MLQLWDIWCYISYGYVATVALNYTFQFYRMHKHINVIHEKDSFNKHLRNYMFYSVEVGSNVKSQVLAVL